MLACYLKKDSNKNMLRKLWNFCSSNKKYLLSLPRSLYYNIRLLPLSQAIRIPIFLSNHVTVKLQKGCQVKVSSNRIHAGMIKIGYSQCDFFLARHHKSTLDLGQGYLIFEGRGNIGAGAKLSIDKGGSLIFGNQFWSTGPILIITRRLIQFGCNCVLSWNITIMDHDAHYIFDNYGTKINEDKAVFLGDHVWLGCNSTILKGTQLSADTIVAANSIVANKKISLSHVILAGSPLEIKRTNIIWGAKGIK